MAFSGTRSAILAALASLILPDGLGNLQLSQTPPQFDSSLKIASTAWVQQAGLQSSGVTNASVTGNLPLSVVGGTVVIGGSATVQTLPALSTVKNGARIGFFLSASATIAGNGTDKINDGPTLVSSIAGGLGDTVVLEALINGTSNQWYIVGGSINLVNSPLFAVSAGTAGYQKLPSGLIIQWGTYLSNNSADVIATFPIAFPNTPIALLTCTGYTPNSGVDGSTSGSYISRSQAQFRSSVNGLGSQYLALGY